jgi:hypothetical protein
MEKKEEKFDGTFTLEELFSPKGEIAILKSMQTWGDTGKQDRINKRIKELEELEQSDN